MQKDPAQVQNRSKVGISRRVVMSILKALQTPVDLVITILLYLAIMGVTSRLPQQYNLAIARFPHTQGATAAVTNATAPQQQLSCDPHHERPSALPSKNPYSP